MSETKVKTTFTNQCRHIWTTTAFRAHHSDGQPWYVFLLRERKFQNPEAQLDQRIELPSDEHMLTIRACPLTGARPGNYVYIAPQTLSAYGGGTQTVKGIIAALDEYGIEAALSTGSNISGMGKKYGRKLWSWSLYKPVSYTEQQGSSGKRRAHLHVRSQALTTIITDEEGTETRVFCEFTFDGPWRTGTDQVVRAAAWTDWNRDMRGFHNVWKNYDEDEFLSTIGVTVGGYIND